MYKLGTQTKYKRKQGSDKANISFQSVLCICIGVFIGFSLATCLRTRLISCGNEAHLKNKLSKNQAKENNNVIFDSIEKDKNLVFVGVMTAQKYLDTRAKAVFDTWGKEIPGKISFFSRAGSSSAFDIPLVSLPGVDDAYPPQKKSFLMLKYMYDHYIDKFEWFMRVDDDVFIKPNKLEQFLRSINSSKPQFIGQAGLGNKDEFGLLSLESDENFCMGGPGIIMSRETLRKVVPNISTCLKNLYSTHEDVEIGRCIRQYAGVACTWSYEMQQIFHHNSSGNEAYTKDLLSREVLRAISLHPIKQHQYQYRVKNFLNQRKMIDLRQSQLRIIRDIFALGKRLAVNEIYEDEIDYANRFNYQPSFRTVRTPKSRSKRHDYSFFTRSLFSSSYISPKRGLESYWKRSIGDLVRQVMDDINKNSIQRGRVIDFKDVLYGYLRHLPTIGIDYIIDVLLVYRKYEGRKMTVTVRRHAYLRQTYSDLIFREDTNVDSVFYHFPEEMIRLHMNKTTDADSLATSSAKNGFFQNFFRLIYANAAENENDELAKKKKRSLIGFLRDVRFNNSKLKELNSVETEIYSETINFIVPLAGRLEIFKRFMENFEEICLKNMENVNLAIILYVDENDKNVNEVVHTTVNNLNKKYLLNNLKVIEVNGNFSRSVACEVGAASFDSKALIFFVDIDMIFTREFLLRVRLNTIESKQVYFPIVFSEFDPDPNVVSGTSMRNPSKGHYDFTLDTGYWRQFGFGIVAAYNSDLRRVGGFDTSIIGWGKEDVDLYEKFIRSNITVFRSVDMGLVHVFHKIECDPNLASEQMIMCIASRATSIASQRTLTDIIYQNYIEKINVSPNFIVNSTVVSEISSKQPVIAVNNNNNNH